MVAQNLLSEVSPSRRIAIAVLAMCIPFSSAVTVAQEYPIKPIRLVVGFGSGTPPDILGRVVGKSMSDLLGQQVVVENRLGAGGTIATAHVASAPPDGYTLTIGSTTNLGIAPALYPNVGYDPKQSFAPVGLVGTAPLFLIVHPSVPATTLQEFMVLVRLRGDRMNYGSGGNGSPPHLVMEMFKSLARVDLFHIPYKGNQFPALVAGDVEATFGSPSTFAHLHKTGKIRLLAVASAARHANYPDIPTMSEAGLPGLEATSWVGIVAPRGTPPEIIARLNGASQKALATKELRDAFANLGTDPAGSTPEAFAALIATEADKWARAVKISGAKVD
jgi:tripartite-type tricarboxylate transporter receptor subunit TctC